MLTWAMVYVIKHGSDLPGGFMFIAMFFDLLIVISITACWWSKYINNMGIVS